MERVRFVAVWTLQRGILETPEPLEDADQWRALSAWRQEESRRVRVHYEHGGEMGETVMWSRSELKNFMRWGKLNPPARRIA